ncbi:MAG TPA: phage holin family protein [Pirellulaceae bacterium]|jgi:hypothetical protein|nr:phage holin family protein [Pirellulaceae bacterium]
MPERIPLTTWLLYAGFGAIGGMAKYIALSLQGEVPLVLTRHTVVWFFIRFFGSLCVAAITGLLAGMAISEIWESQTAILVGAGLFGHAGNKGIDQLVKMYKVRQSK